MRIYDYWVQTGSRVKSPDGMEYWLSAWGGSNRDVDDAKAQALKSVEATRQKLQENGSLNGHYEYGHDRSLKEKVIERFGDSEHPYAAITRNRYGALVLNSARVFFADVDREQTVQVPDKAEFNAELARKKKSTQSGPISSDRTLTDRLFGWLKSSCREQVRRSKQFQVDRYNNERDKLLKLAEEERVEQERLAFERFKAFHEKFPALSFRVYETAAGYRVLVTNQTLDTSSDESSNWLDELGSDKLYRTLCEKQQCYRARLTPKPWRLPDFESRVFEPNPQNNDKPWLKKYENLSKDFSVCRLVETYGDGAVVDGVADVLEIHDSYVLNGAADQLA